MWIAFRLDEGDFLLPSPGSEDRAQEQNHQIPNADGVVQMLEPAEEGENHQAERE